LKSSYDELVESWDIREEQIVYICNVSHRFKICYVEVAKAACSTIKKTLQTAEIYPEPWDFDTPNMTRSESPLGSINSSNFAPILYGNEYFRFSFVRDPFTRVLSAYLEKLKGYRRRYRKKLINQEVFDYISKEFEKLNLYPEKNISFLEFLRSIAELSPHDLDIHWCPQHILLNIDEIKYDHIGKFERFTKNFKVVQNVIYTRTGIEADIRSVKWHKVGARSKAKYYLTKETADLVSKIYAADYEYFGYPLPRPGWTTHIFPHFMPAIEWFYIK